MLLQVLPWLLTTVTSRSANAKATTCIKSENERRVARGLEEARYKSRKFTLWSRHGYHRIHVVALFCSHFFLTHTLSPSRILS
ncbi:hypothetical protein BGW80DRAFT_1315119 [Lactifluus volemus]|nr:hypothetical protein BGW80DRAFT_1315119 [Lactifluus volemus]